MIPQPRDANRSGSGASSQDYHTVHTHAKRLATQIQNDGGGLFAIAFRFFFRRPVVLHSDRQLIATDE